MNEFNLPNDDSKTVAMGIFAGSLPAVLAPLLVMGGIVLLVVGVGRIQLRWLAAGGALFALATLLALLGDEEPWHTVEAVSLRVRTIDAATGRPVTPTRVQIEGADGKPSSVSTVGQNGQVLVSAMVETIGNGSLGAHLQPGARLVDLQGYQLQVEAQGYRPGSTPLGDLLPRDWPLV
ncbi:MAG: hypothetical protein ACREJM_13855, partial [Candidatus Saccharimonadales bacterium]